MIVRMKLPAIVVWLGVTVIGSTQPDSIRIGSVEFFGTVGINVAAVRARLPIRAGDAIDHNRTSELRAKIQTAVAEVTGHAPTDTAAVCCNAKGELLVYLGLPGTNNHTITHQSAPTGSTCLPQAAVDRHNRAVDANQKAAENGDTAEDDSLGYALAHNPELRQAQLEMRAFATTNVSQIVGALHGCAKDEHRRAASMLLGYADRSPDQIAELVRAANDADSTVRNNALRALAVLAAPSAEAAAGIQADALIELLNSGDWTDRNKAGLLFMRLTDARRPDLLAALTREAFDSLVEMARWQDAPHAVAYRVILGRIAGIEEPRLVELANGTGVEEIVAAAVKKRRVAEARGATSRAGIWPSPSR